MTSLPTDLSGINICSINPAHQLWAFGGEEGDIEFWHPTTKQRIAKLDVSSILRQSPEYSETFDSTGTCEITCVKFADDGLTFSVGVSTGQVLVYDLRRPTPIIIKDHQYGFPIKNIIYHGSGNIVSADTKIVKIWDKNNVNESEGENLDIPHVYLSTPSLSG